jgi:hypothetical protein
MWLNKVKTQNLMVKHIVLWRLKDAAEGENIRTNALRIKEKLEALQGQIPQILKIEVGINFTVALNKADVALYSEFVSPADLEAYISHPLHVEAGKFIRSVVAERRSVDYEC